MDVVHLARVEGVRHFSLLTAYGANANAWSSDLLCAPDSFRPSHDLFPGAASLHAPSHGSAHGWVVDVKGEAFFED